VTALNNAACWAPIASPPTICHRNKGGTLVVAIIASCEPAEIRIESASNVRVPKRSIRTPDGIDSSAAARVATENKAPT